MSEKQDYLLPFLDDVSNFMGRRWGFRILWELRYGNRIRFQQLQKSLLGISSSTLSASLKNLHDENLVSRTVQGKNPPLKVEYAITKKGLDLIIASSCLVKWAIAKKIA